MDLERELTNDFVQAFYEKGDCHGAMARVIAMGELPLGVNSEDPRVKKIIIWCQENEDNII